MMVDITDMPLEQKAENMLAVLNFTEGQVDNDYVEAVLIDAAYVIDKQSQEIERLTTELLIKKGANDE